MKIKINQVHKVFKANMTSLGASRPKVLRIGKVAYAQKKWDELSEVAEVILCESKNREEFFQDLKGKYKDVNCITRTFQSILETGRFDAELANQLPSSVKTISHQGAGYDQVDVDEFTPKGIQVSNVTTPVEAPTADTAIYLLLGATRNFQEGHNLLVEGNWTKKPFAGASMGHLPSGKTIGILGMGGIGRAIRDRLLPFGYKRIIYHNRKQLKPELEKGTEYVSYDGLLSQSDIIIISIPLNTNTRHTINKDTISKMKDGVVLINTARGAIINEADLLCELKSGKVGAFGSDVFEHEPEVPKELLELPNVVSLPHMGTYAPEAGKNMEEFVIDNVLTFLYTGKVKSIVPEQYNMKIDEKPIFTK